MKGRGWEISSVTQLLEEEVLVEEGPIAYQEDPFAPEPFHHLFRGQDLGGEDLI